MKVQVLDEAEHDLLDGFRFYEMQGVGLGDYFLNSVFADIDSLQLYSGIHPIQFSYHRLLCRRFPFAVYYPIARETAQVYAVLDCRQNPTKTRERLSGQ